MYSAKKDLGQRIKPKGKNTKTGAYPEQLKGSGLSDKVRVEFVITPEGRAVNPKVVQIEHQEFMIPAIIHAAKFRFNPPAKKGAPVYAEEFYVIEFSE